MPVVDQPMISITVRSGTPRTKEHRRRRVTRIVQPRIPHASPPQKCLPGVVVAGREDHGASVIDRVGHGDHGRDGLKQRVSAEICSGSSESRVDPGVQRVDVPALPGGIGEFDRGDRVYLDDNHVTATYLNTMSSIVEQAIDSALGWRQPETPM
jgi:hypothetical protein